MTEPARQRTEAELTPQLLALMEHEKPLEDATASRADVWFALDAIREKELYRAAGYDTFVAYIERHWGSGE